MWLPWLNKKQRNDLNDIIENTAMEEIAKRHWGTRARGDSPGGAKRIYVTDIRGLVMASGTIRYALHKYDTDVYYRGQNKDWELYPSVYRGAKKSTEAVARVNELKSALSLVSSKFDPIGTDDEREALAQHYGCRTRWIDVVDHLNTAAWFAYNRTSVGEDYDTAVGYVYLIAIPRGDNPYLMVIDLRRKPATWLRPHVQQSFALRAKNDTRFMGCLSEYLVVTFVIPRTFLRMWSAYDALPPDIMFPNPLEDRGLLFARDAQQILQAENIKVWPSQQYRIINH